MRKLLVPLVQVNIAERQVNVTPVGVPIGGDGPASLGEMGDAVEALEGGEPPDGAE